MVLVKKFMVDVNRDKEDGLDPDTARTWKDQVYQIVDEAELFRDSSNGDGAAPPAPAEPTALKLPDCLAPLRLAIRIATHTTEAVAKEIQDPSEAVLRSYAKQLEILKKEIMTLSRSLMVGQAASVATEATRLANEAGETIKSSREVIRAALRGLGVASDISEASGPTRAQQAAPARARDGGPGRGLGGGTSTDRFRMAARLHASYYCMAPPGFHAEAQNREGGWRTVNPHAWHDECPGKRQQVAHLQWEVRGVPSIPQGVVGLQADLPWAHVGRAGVPQP